MIDDTLYFDNKIFQFIYSFHMPCFMVISGFFFGFSIDNKQMWKRRIQSLLIPIIAWSVIPVGVKVLKAIREHSFSGRTILSCGETILSNLWFLWAILFCSAIVWCIHKCFKDNVWIYLAIGILLLFLPNISNLHLWIYMYPFFTAGYLWNKKNPDIKVLLDHKILTSAVIIAFYCLLFCFYNRDSFIYTTGITVRSLSQLGIDFYRYAIGFVGSAMVLWLTYVIYCSGYVKQGITNLLNCLGRISLSIYIISGLINSYILPRLTKGFNLNYGITMVETIIVILVCAGADWLIKKIPIARRVLLGGR